MTMDEENTNEKSNNWTPRIGNIKSKIAKKFEEDWDKYYAELPEGSSIEDSKN